MTFNIRAYLSVWQLLWPSAIEKHADVFIKPRGTTDIVCICNWFLDGIMLHLTCHVMFRDTGWAIRSHKGQSPAGVSLLSSKQQLSLAFQMTFLSKLLHACVLAYLWNVATKVFSKAEFPSTVLYSSSTQMCTCSAHLIEYMSDMWTARYPTIHFNSACTLEVHKCALAYRVLRDGSSCLGDSRTENPAGLYPRSSACLC